VEVDGSTKFKAVLTDLGCPIGKEVTVAVRPEKLNLFPSEGLMTYPDSSTDKVDNYKASLLKDPDINLMQAKVREDIYIGTDTRYLVGIGEKQNVELVARVQNFGLRSESWYEKGQTVNIFWDAETARILKD